MKKMFILISIFAVLIISGCKNNSIEESVPSISQSSSIVSVSASSVSAASSSEIFDKNTQEYTTSIEKEMSNITIEQLMPDNSCLSYDIDTDEREQNLREFEWYRTEPDANRICKAQSNTSDEISIEGIYSSFFPPINNSISIQDVITDCALETVVHTSRHAIFSKTSLSNTPEDWPYRQYPIVFLRQVQPGYYYTVHKLQNGGWIYTFFAPFPHNTEETGVYEYCNDLSHVYCSGGVYVENVLSYNNFESISIGSSYNDVKEIDSSVAVYRLAHECKGYQIPGTKPVEYVENYMETRHLLADGLLTIIYEKQNDDWIVCDMIYSDEFIYEPSYYKWAYQEAGVPQPAKFLKQFKILPQDYPPAS